MATTLTPRSQRAVFVGLGLLLAVVTVFVAIRVVTDTPHIVAGTVPDDDFSVRYVAHPWVAYLHIAPGAIFLLLAPLQLLARIRRRHYTAHRRRGRGLVVCGMASGVLALALGVGYAWGGAVEAAATVVFGLWFLLCLLLAVLAIRRGSVSQHRRWMVRAFAVALGIGTIRVWVGLFTGLFLATSRAPDTLPDPATFALAFWLGLGMHVAGGEWWLRRTPALDA